MNYFYSYHPTTDPNTARTAATDTTLPRRRRQII